MTGPGALSAGGGQGRRTAWGLLASRDFGLLFLAKLLATCAVWAHGTAAAIVVFDRTGETALVAVVTISQFAPQLVLTPLTGSWADRYDATAQLIAGRLCCVTGSLLLIAWLFWGAGSAPGEVTIAVATSSLIVGVGFVIGGPAFLAVIPALVRSDELGTAMALNIAPLSIARIVGPSLGALVVVVGPLAAFIGTTLAHVMFIPLVILARLPRRPSTVPAKKPRVWGALKYAREDRGLRRALLGVLAIGFGSEPVLALSPAFATELGAPASAVGLLITAFGAGAGFALVMLTVWRDSLDSAFLAGAGFVLLVTGLLGCAVLPVYWMCLAASVVMGAGFSLGLTGVSTTVQLLSPPAFRGRIMALWMMGFAGSRPLAVAVAGLTADLASVRVAFATIGALVAVIGVFSWPRRT